MNAESFFLPIWYFVQGLIGWQLIWPFIMFLLWGITLRQKKRSQPTKNSVAKGDYAIIVTAYQHTETLNDAVASLCQLNHNQFLIYVVADNCDTSSLVFEDNRVVLLKPETVLASNTKSHFYAIRNFRRQHDRLTIIDCDNMVDPEYLNELDNVFAEGFEAVQGMRKAKNLNTEYACLDAARDAYYHFYDGKLLYELGSSASLAGSGMAFSVALYRECLSELDITGAGFDKVLQYEIVKRNQRIAYTDRAIVYDEKTAYTDQLVKQRARWINTWFRYFKLAYCLLLKGVTHRSMNQLLFGAMLVRPPLFIMLILAIFFALSNIVMANLTITVAWLIGLVIFVMGFFIALHFAKPDKRVYKAIRAVPKFVFFQMISLLKSKKANRLSVATKHYHYRKTGKEEIEEVTTDNN